MQIKSILAGLALLAISATGAVANEPKPLNEREMDTVAAGFYPGYAGIATYDSAAARAYYQQVRSDLDALSALLRSLY